MMKRVFLSGIGGLLFLCLCSANSPAASLTSKLASKINTATRICASLLTRTVIRNQPVQFSDQINESNIEKLFLRRASRPGEYWSKALVLLDEQNHYHVVIWPTGDIFGVDNGIGHREVMWSLLNKIPDPEQRSEAIARLENTTMQAYAQSQHQRHLYSNYDLIHSFGFEMTARRMPDGSMKITRLDFHSNLSKRLAERKIRLNAWQIASAIYALADAISPRVNAIDTIYIPSFDNLNMGDGNRSVILFNLPNTLKGPNRRAPQIITRSLEDKQGT